MTPTSTVFDSVARTDDLGRIVLPATVLGLRNFEPNSEVPLFFTDFGVELLSPKRLQQLRPSAVAGTSRPFETELDGFDTVLELSVPDDLPALLSAHT
jgi:hypothetical protein